MKNVLFISLLLIILPLFSIGQNKDLESIYQAGEFSKCISLSKEIINANQKSDLEVLEALNYMVICHTWKAEYDKGEIYLNKSNPLITQIDSIKDKSTYLNYLFAKGWLLHMTSQSKEALTIYNKVLDLYIDDVDTKDALYFLITNKIGELYYYHFREIAMAKKYFQEALDGFQSVGTTSELDLALCYYDNSVLQQTLDNLKLAMAYANKAYEFSALNTSEVPTFKSMCMNLISTVHYQQNNNKKAIDWMYKQIEYRKKIMPNEIIPFTYSNNLISYLTEDQQLDRALNLAKQTLKVFRENGDTTLYNYSRLLTNFGSIYATNNQMDLALKYYNRAFVVLEPIVGKDNILYTRHLFNIADYYFKDKNYSDAFYYNNQAITNLQATEDGIISEEKSNDLIDYYYLNALIHLQQSNYQFAFNDLMNADTMISIKREHANWNRTKLDLSARAKDVYNKLIDICYKFHQNESSTKYVKLANQFIEKNKSMLLWETINRNLLMTIDLEDTDLRNQLNGIESAVANLEIKYANQQSDSIITAIDLLEQRRKRIKNEITSTYQDQISTIEQNSISSITTIQKQLNKNEHILNFYESDSMLYCITISQNDIDFKGKILDKAILNEISEFYSRISDFSLEQLAFSSTDYNSLSYLIYDWLMDIIPSQAVVKNNQITIIPDGLLYRVPFEALTYEKTESSNYKSLSYLIKRLKISYCPSVSIWNNLIQVKTNTSKAATSNLLLLSDGLSGSIEEVNYISQLYGIKQSMSYVESNEILEDIMHFNRLHVASHVKIDTSNEFGNYIHLDGKEGAIKLYDYQILNHKFNLDHVYLNGCSTNDGKEMSGEGVFNLSRSFIASGTPIVVCNLWEVSDNSSSKIAKTYYKELKSSNNNYQNALRKTKLKYIQSNTNQYAHPYFWAATISVGNLTNPNTRHMPKQFYLVLALFFLISFIGIITLKNKHF